MKNLMPWILPGLLLLALPAWSAQPDHEKLTALIENFVRAQTASLPGRVAIKVGEVDKHIAPPACPLPEIFLPPGSQLFGNSTVGVRCPNTPKSRPLFVRVQIKVTASLIVARKSLQLGQTLGADDIISQDGELTQTNTLTEPALAIGKVLKLSVGAGQALRSDMLRPPFSVMQGQTVQLRAEGSGFSIRSEGQALNNAAEGQGVRVKTPSGQTVSGTAQTDGSVSIRP
ncbi:MAG: flagellar basal body P-ring formation protein FlgA [Nitrosomonadales bacterium]|nr:flagellar basal body P-ring formation protein FlgA [Nitrosomonadales bacterium]